MHSPHFLVDPEADVIPEFREESAVTHQQKSGFWIESHRLSKIRISKWDLTVIRTSGYQGVPACGRQGDQIIRVSGLIISYSLFFPDILTPGILHPDFLIP
jgi:hypothetical protein